MSWLLRLWPWHEHVYCHSSYEDGILRKIPYFRCRCGATIEGHELFRPDSMMGRYWREQYPERFK